MSKRKDDGLRPRNGHTLSVVIVARISGGPKQKGISLDDQVDHGKEEARALYDGEAEYQTFATKGKGERLDRPELAEIEALLRTKTVDLLVCEDIGRLIRGAEAARLCGIGVDHGVRIVAPNDGFDTNSETWYEDVIGLCQEHAAYVAHLSRRIKHKCMNRFKKFGGAPALETFGYRKLKPEDPYPKWERDDEATPIFREWFRRLRETRCWFAVAVWLNQKGVPTGKYCKSRKWTGAMVRRVTQNPILKGIPIRGRRHTVRHNETGTRRLIKNPAGPNTFECPHLAHIDPAEFDEVNALMRDAKRGFGRKPINGQDPLLGVPRKWTVWPGQHILCGVCGNLFVWGGHGQNSHMMCTAIREHECWCTVTFDGIEASARIGHRVLAEIEALPGFDDHFLRRVRAQAEASTTRRKEDERKLEREAREIKAGLERLADFILKEGHNAVLAGRLRTLEERRCENARALDRLRAERDDALVLPPIAKIKDMARASVVPLAAADQSFGAAMRKLLPRILVFPFRAIDSDRVVARCLVDLDLAGALPAAQAGASAGLLRTSFWVDLFDPPQRVVYRERVRALKEQKLTEREIARRLGLTQPIVQQALKLDRMMVAAGLTDPYVPLKAPPEGRKYRQHLHPQYAFRPRDGFPAWSE
jgi:hypothetical protein